MTFENKNVSTPTRIELPTRAKPVALGAAASWSAVITDDGSLFTWGDNTHGQLGLGDKETRNVPHHVDLPFLVSRVACGHYHMLLLSREGDLYVCGKNSSGELGLAEGVPSTSVVLKNSRLENITRIFCGSCHSMALTRGTFQSPLPPLSFLVPLSSP
jgi:alpha-tubulin suppressor-like RCC1 family protein